jgi:hypothetical protein
VTYLFYANDPGDHYSKTQRRPAPSAELSDEGVGYVVKHPPPSRDTRIARTRQFVERTLIARLLRMQLTLLGAKFGAMYDHSCRHRRGRPIRTTGRRRGRLHYWRKRNS